MRTVSAAIFAAAIITTLFLAITLRADAATDIVLMHSFTGGNDGAYPDDRLTQDASGNFYGTTQIGGAFAAGTIFELSPNRGGKWNLSVLYAFTGGADGGNPLGSLTFDAAGNAYATVSSGTANGFGGVIELTPATQPNKPWTEQVLYSFQAGNDGALPFGNVIFDAAGNLYGTTSIGGTRHIGCLAGCGTIYELSPDGNGGWTEKVLHRLIDAFGQGAEPRAGLIMDKSGNLFGTTYEGGDNDVCGGTGCGSVFELAKPAPGKTRWQFKNLINFNATNGALVRGGVTFDANGALYGTTIYGGTNNAGTVFSLTYEAGHWRFKTIYNFDGINGLQPSGNLAFDAAGNLYGATYQGGANDWGSIFQLVPGASGWTENILYNFVISGKKFGASPLGGVTLDAAGNLYMTTNQGGIINDCQPNAGCGTVLKLRTTN